jgi:N-acetylglucosaminyl-diphospho-decaprenol L-rhamnosyltransferase
MRTYRHMQNHPYQSGNLDVTIIIVSYNTRDMTVECIQSIQTQSTSVRYEVIVVDNGSADGSAEAVRTKFPNVKLIASQENLGFAGANNLAATHAGGRRLLLLNPDTVVLDHAIDRLHEFAVSNPECRIWGGRTVFADGSLNPQSCWGRPTLWSLFCSATGLSTLKRSSLFNPEGYGGWQRDTVRAVDIVVGCFFLIDRDLWEELHGFDSVFFMYGEEADLCLRAQEVGARPTITPTATIIHYAGASEPDRADKLIKLLASRTTLIKRHWSPLSASAGRLLLLTGALVRLVIFGIFYNLLGRADFQDKAQKWREVWAGRHRWVNGWSESGKTTSGDASS